LLVVKARLLEIQEYQEMSALFPTFLSLGKRIKLLLATDVKSIWQGLKESPDLIEAYVVGECLYWDV
jgi:hypothetical protein